MHINPLNQVIDIADMHITLCVMLIADLLFYFTLKNTRERESNALAPLTQKKER